MRVCVCCVCAFCCVFALSLRLVCASTERRALPTSIHTLAGVTAHDLLPTAAPFGRCCVGALVRARLQPLELLRRVGSLSQRIVMEVRPMTTMRVTSFVAVALTCGHRTPSVRFLLVLLVTSLSTTVPNFSVHFSTRPLRYESVHDSSNLVRGLATPVAVSPARRVGAHLSHWLRSREPQPRGWGREALAREDTTLDLGCV
jgi:hypothetical protein